MRRLQKKTPPVIMPLNPTWIGTSNPYPPLEPGRGKTYGITNKRIYPKDTFLTSMKKHMGNTLSITSEQASEIRKVFTNINARPRRK
jgi:hypothetical protein